MTDYGFIITRHVNSEQTNKYWNQCVQQIRKFYPYRPIVIIDDNSVQKHIKEFHSYSDVCIIQSEYPGRGELLPYVYYLKYKWFPNAVIIHDSVFIHKRIAFETFHFPVLPLWHHVYDKDNVKNILRITSILKRNGELTKKIVGTNINILGLNKDHFNLCFGGQAYIRLTFLEYLQNKYEFTRLIHPIRNRTDRCSFERIIGLLFCEEYPQLLLHKSVFGDILTKRRAFHYHYDDYIKDIANGHILYPFIKVWTGR
jgi:hypothetical protein